MFTPGPWHVERELDIFDATGRLVAFCNGYTPNLDIQKSHDENMSNARLIIGVHDLLEACKCVVGILEHNIPSETGNDEIDHQLQKAFDILCNAIEKATGETSVSFLFNEETNE